MHAMIVTFFHIKNTYAIKIIASSIILMAIQDKIRLHQILYHEQKIESDL